MTQALVTVKTDVLDSLLANLAIPMLCLVVITERDACMLDVFDASMSSTTFSTASS